KAARLYSPERSGHGRSGRRAEAIPNPSPQGMVMASEWIELGASRAYVAIPAAGSGPGLLIIAPDGTGKAATERADLYAEEGYVTVAAAPASAADANAALRKRREIAGKVGAIGIA